MNLQLEVDLINEPRVVKMMNDYFYEGYAIFVLILCELCKQKDYKYSLKDLDILYVNIKANIFLRDRNFINTFVHNCINKYESKGKYLFQSNGLMFWSDDLIEIIRKKETKRKNGEKGGRPAKPIVQNPIKKADIEYVNLEKTDYEKLTAKFGTEMIDTGIVILDNWLATIKAGNPAPKKYMNKNHYSLFRRDGWVLRGASKELERNNKTSIWGNI